MRTFVAIGLAVVTAGLAALAGGPEVGRQVAAALRPGQPRMPTDFYQFWAPAWEWREGRSPYTPLPDTYDRNRPRLGAVPDRPTDQMQLLPVCAYPPPTVLLFAPLTGLAFSDAYDLWLGVTVAAAGLAAVALGRGLVGGPLGWAAGVGIAALLLTSAPMRTELRVGNVNAIILVTVTLSWAAGRRERSAAAGVWAAAAALVKLFPGLLIVHAVATDRRAAGWMIAAGLAGGLAAVAAMGLAHAWEFVGVTSASTRWYGSDTNMSVCGFWHRLFVGWSDPQTGTPVVVPLADAPAAAKAGTYATAGLLLAALVGVGLVRRPTDPAAKEAYFAAVVACMVLLSPVSWPNTLLVLAPAVGILWRWAGWGVRLLAVYPAGAVLWVHPNIWLRRFHTDGTAFQPWESATLVSARTFAALLLFAVALWLTWKRPVSGPPPAP